METATAIPPNTALPVTKPPNVYSPGSNSHSTGPAVPVSEMLRSQEARYQRLWNNESAFATENKVAAPTSADTASPSNCEDGIKADAEGLGWASWWPGLFPNPFRGSDPSTHPSHQEEYDRVKLKENLDNFEGGIPRLAALLNIDESFGIFRAFLPQAARILLHQMIKLTKLVERQHELDVLDAGIPEQCRLNTVDPLGNDGFRAELEKQISEGIKEYHETLERYVKIKALAKPTKSMHRSLHNWMIEKRPLVEGEDNWIYPYHDLVSTMMKGDNGNSEGSQADTFLEDYVIGKPGSFVHRYLTGKDKNIKTGLFLYQENRLRVLRKTRAVVISVCLLLLPVFILFLVSMPRLAMVFTVFGFILAFSVIMSLMTDARLQELLLGTAAYGAFLATFLGNMNQCFVPTV